jgi:hypothetical protein
MDVSSAELHNSVDMKSPNVKANGTETEVTQVASPVQETASRLDQTRSWFGYVKTKQFWLVLVFG